MRVLVAGGTGAIGRRLVPLLTDHGHQVTVLSRSGAPVDRAASVAVDALDATALTNAVHQAEPDAIVNLLTAIPDPINARQMSQQFALTNRLRVEATRTLLAGAPSRFVAESIAFAYQPGPQVADESTPLWPEPPQQLAAVLEAVRTLEEQTAAAGGTVLRIGHLHGPGTTYGPGGGMRTAVQDRKLPVVGGGTSVFSFAHVDDAAAAFAAALTGPVGTYNVVDDDPAEVSTWLPAYARSLGAKPPRKAPAGIAKLAVGEWGVAFMTQLRGASNARAKVDLGWAPQHPWPVALARA